MKIKPRTATGDALAVLMLNPRMADLILKNDPKAYTQAVRALQDASYPTCVGQLACDTYRPKE